MPSEADFLQVQRDFHAQAVQLDPARAVEMGLADSVPRMPGAGPEVEEAKVRAWETAAVALGRLPTEALSADQRLDVELVRSEAERHRLLHDHGRYGPAGGDPALEVSELLDQLYSRETFAPEVRAEGILARLQGVGDYLDQARARYTRPVWHWTAEAIHSAARAREFLEELPRGVAAFLDGAISEDEASRLEAAIEGAAWEARGHLEDFGRWLERDVTPRSTHDMALGPEVFGELIRRRRLGRDVDELRELGRESYATLEASYEEAMGELYPGQAVAEAEDTWMEEIPEGFPAVLEMFREAVAASRSFVVDDLGIPLPPGTERLEVRETPKFLHPVIPSAAYFDPPRFAEGEQVGIYMVTPSDQGIPHIEHTPGMIFNVSTHEGYPGHHLQLSWANANPSLFRAWLSGDEFCEGWAHYCEEMCTEAGFAPVPGMRAAQLKDAAFRAVRIRLDIGLQTGELGFEDAIRVLVDEGHTSEERARGEIGWYSYSPGYPLGYLTGKLLLWDLRRAVEREEGDGFDAAAFHRRVLEGGTMPIWGHARSLGVDLGL